MDLNNFLKILKLRLLIIEEKGKYLAVQIRTPIACGKVQKEVIGDE